MRSVMPALLLLSPMPLAAQAPGVAVAPGETALHIVARGEVQTRADRIELPVTVSGRGASVAEARASAEASATALVTALVAAGIDRSSIVRSPAAMRVTFVAPPVIAAPISPGAVRTPTMTQAVSVQLVLPADAVDRARQVVAGQAQAQAGTPVPKLLDDAAARRAATKDAVAQARRDADDYAAALGLRVVRVVAASNAAGIGDGLDTLVQQFRDLDDHHRSSDTVVTHASAVVDYALAPMR